jgi:hypothetical protein
MALDTIIPAGRRASAALIGELQDVLPSLLGNYEFGGRRHCISDQVADEKKLFGEGGYSAIEVARILMFTGRFVPRP